jgi:hypothetical protein
VAGCIVYVLGATRTNAALLWLLFNLMIGMLFFIEWFFNKTLRLFLRSPLPSPQLQ